LSFLSQNAGWRTFGTLPNRCRHISASSRGFHLYYFSIQA